VENNLLIYQETNWKKENGFEIRKVQLDIKSIQASETVNDQRARIEKLSIVAFLRKKQKRILIMHLGVSKEMIANFTKTVIHVLYWVSDHLTKYTMG
jgi:hypothetical protein